MNTHKVQSLLMLEIFVINFSELIYSRQLCFDAFTRRLISSHERQAQVRRNFMNAKEPNIKDSNLCPSLVALIQRVYSNHRVLHGTQKLCIVIMSSFRFNFFEKQENEQTNKYLTFCWFNSERDKKRSFYCGTEDHYHSMLYEAS